jgi:hypothetical protein
LDLGAALLPGLRAEARVLVLFGRRLFQGLLGIIEQPRQLILGHGQVVIGHAAGRLGRLGGNPLARVGALLDALSTDLNTEIAGAPLAMPGGLAALRVGDGSQAQAQQGTKGAQKRTMHR